MRDPSPFKWRHFEAEIVLCAVRWYLHYALSYRDIEELMHEGGVSVDHTAVFRWVQRYGPALERRCQPLLKATNDSYRVDETYIKIKKLAITVCGRHPPITAPRPPPSAEAGSHVSWCRSGGKACGSQPSGA